LALRAKSREAIHTARNLRLESDLLRRKIAAAVWAALLGREGKKAPRG
jgi:hypothetical protein